MPKDNNKLKRIFANDPEMLRLLESQDQTELLKFLAKEKVKSDIETKMVKIEHLKGEPGDQGEKGDTFLFEDLTDEQKAELKGEKGDDGYTPVKGVDYFDGEDADVESIIQRVKKIIPTAEEILALIPPVEMPEFNEELLLSRFMANIPKSPSF